MTNFSFAWVAVRVQRAALAAIQSMILCGGATFLAVAMTWTRSEAQDRSGPLVVYYQAHEIPKGTASINIDHTGTSRRVRVVFRMTECTGYNVFCSLQPTELILQPRTYGQELMPLWLEDEKIPGRYKYQWSWEYIDPDPAVVAAEQERVERQGRERLAQAVRMRDAERRERERRRVKSTVTAANAIDASTKAARDAAARNREAEELRQAAAREQEVARARQAEADRAAAEQQLVDARAAEREAAKERAREEEAAAEAARQAEIDRIKANADAQLALAEARKDAATGVIAFLGGLFMQHEANKDAERAAERRYFDRIEQEEAALSAEELEAQQRGEFANWTRRLNEKRAEAHAEVARLTARKPVSDIHPSLPIRRSFLARWRAGVEREANEGDVEDYFRRPREKDQYPERVAGTWRVDTRSEWTPPGTAAYLLELDRPSSRKWVTHFALAGENAETQQQACDALVARLAKDWRRSVMPLTTNRIVVQSKQGVVLVSLDCVTGASAEAVLTASFEPNPPGVPAMKAQLALSGWVADSLAADGGARAGPNRFRPLLVFAKPRKQTGTATVTCQLERAGSDTSMTLEYVLTAVSGADYLTISEQDAMGGFVVIGTDPEVESRTIMCSHGGQNLRRIEIPIGATSR